METYVQVTGIWLTLISDCKRRVAIVSTADGTPRERWTLEEVKDGLGDLFAAAAENGPQEIWHNGRRFILVAATASSPSGIELLRRGGPMEDSDSLD